MLIKIECHEPHVSPKILATINMETIYIKSLVEQIKKGGITWETTNVSFSFHRSGYAYAPFSKTAEDSFYFKIEVVES